MFLATGKAEHSLSRTAGSWEDVSNSVWECNHLSLHWNRGIKTKFDLNYREQNMNTLSSPLAAQTVEIGTFPAYVDIFCHHLSHWQEWSHFSILLTHMFSINSHLQRYLYKVFPDSSTVQILFLSVQDYVNLLTFFVQRYLHSKWWKFFLVSPY